MNKRLIKTLIGIWAIIIIFLIGILIYAVSNKKGIYFNFDFDSNFGPTKVQKEESINADNLNKINVDFGSADIEIKATDDKEIKICEKSNKKLDKKNLFTTSKDGDTLTIEKPNNIHIFTFGSYNEKIEISIPKSYAKDLNVHSSSGNVILASDATLNELKLSASSGNIKTDYTVKASSFYAKTSSGNISINSLNTEKYEFTATSGNIKAESLEGSGSVRVSSGNIKLNMKDVKDYLSAYTTSGNIHISIPKDLSFEFNGDCTSGDIDASFDLNYKTKRGNKAAAKIGNGPYKKIDASASSGDINISQY